MIDKLKKIFRLHNEEPVLEVKESDVIIKRFKQEFPKELSGNYENERKEQTEIFKDGKKIIVQKGIGKAMNSYDFVSIMQDRLTTFRRNNELNIIRKDPESLRVYRNEKINQIFKTLIEYAPSGNIWEFVAELICDDMEKYNFNDVPSLRYPKVESKDHLRAHENVSLLDHTYNLVVILDSDKKKKNNLYDEYLKVHPVYKVLFGAVLHDFGKSPQIAELVHMTEDSDRYTHSNISARYIRNVIMSEGVKGKFGSIVVENSDYERSYSSLDSIADGVLNHHARRSSLNFLDSCISHLDSKARRYEILIHEKEKGAN